MTRAAADFGLDPGVAAAWRPYIETCIAAFSLFASSSNHRRPARQCGCRVEERRGCKPLGQPRFPSPLIKPDVRISRIRLSDWFRCEAHGGNPTAELRGPQRSCHGEIVWFRGLVPYAAE